MSLILKSTKLFDGLSDFSKHEYTRSVRFEFSGTPDDNGWIIGFDHLEAVEAFLKYYFDHTVLQATNESESSTTRVLPYGVSMEMISIFVWENVNPFIYDISEGRCWVSRVEVHESPTDSAFVEVDQKSGLQQGEEARNAGQILVKKASWDFTEPSTKLTQYNQQPEEGVHINGIQM
jgi:6-pyruvoyl-tetrahydropterin synthase